MSDFTDSNYRDSAPLGLVPWVARTPNSASLDQCWCRLCCNSYAETVRAHHGQYARYSLAILVLRPIAVCVDVKSVHLILTWKIFDLPTVSMNVPHTPFQPVPRTNSGLCHVSCKSVRHKREHWDVCCNECQRHRGRSE